MFNIGDTVWLATFQTEEKNLTCPDCAGNGCLTIIMGDGDQHSIQCDTCKRGFEAPTGKVSYYEKTARSRVCLVTGVRQESGGFRYDLAPSYWADDTTVFASEDEAVQAAALMATIDNAEEIAKKTRKHEQNRSWAWNAHYHRRQLKEAQRQLEYHTAMLNVAKVKAKELVEAS